MGQSDRKNGHLKLRGLTYSTSKSGVRYYYFRKKGQPKIPLGRGPIDDPAFLAKYAEAAKANPPKMRAKEGSVRSVVDAFMASTTWEAYSASYKASMGRHMGELIQAYGLLPWASLEPRHIRADLASLKPHAAANRLKAWRNLSVFAFDRGWHASNPAESVKRSAIPKTDGHLPWTPVQIEGFRAAWPVGSVQRLCMELLYWTGARTVDAVKLSPSMVKDGVLEFTQQKTGGKVFVPWTCALPVWAQEFEADRAFLFECLQVGVFTYLETNGRARSRKGLSNVVSAAAKKAGIERSAHGLRKARLTAIAEAGGSAHAIMSWGGHKTLSEAQEYVSSADQRRLIMSTPAAQSVHTHK